MKISHSWQLFALGSAFFAGLTAIFGKLGVTGLNFNMATFIRIAVLVPTTALVLTGLNQWQNPAGMPHRALFFLVVSALATGASWLCYYRALQLGDATRVAPVDKLSVVFAIVLAIIFLGEKATPQVLIGGVLITAGAVVMIL